MNNFWVIYKKEWLEIVRTKRLLILIILFGFIAIASPVLAKVTPMLLKSMPATPGLTINLPDPTWHDAIDQLVKNISQIALTALIFIFAGIVCEEKNKKTLEMTLAKPISRSRFILAKFWANLLAMTIIYFSSLVVFYFYTVSIFGNFDLASFARLSLFLFLYLVIIYSVTIFFSSISKNQIAAAGLSFLFLIIITIILSLFSKIINYLPSYILGHYKDIFDAFSLQNFLPSILTEIILVFILVISSVQIFKQQEIER
ncbi:MAG: ABC transporter permease subunit [Candidatus Berkelbacteria bacterium]|nr:ABC transporter permease subunit [Candidatus Berkelbacteria bacterium]